MAEYIERKALFRTIENIPDNELLGNDNTTFVELPTVLDIISEQPTADVQEIVRCKDCNYFSKATVNKKGFLICSVSGMEITDNDFCSYGERKCGDGNG